MIDTRSDRVVEKIWARQTPADLFGAQPNALAFDPSGRRLYVCNGTQNAVAVIRFDPKARASKRAGLIPVGWFPGASPVRCLEAEGSWWPTSRASARNRMFKPGERVKLNSHDSFGTVSMVPVACGRRLRGV